MAENFALPQMMLDTSTTRADKASTNLHWSDVACSNLSATVRSVSQNALPDGFPKAADLERQITNCAPKLKTSDAIELYNITSQEQPAYHNFTDKAGQLLKQQQDFGLPLTPELSRRLQAIESYPSNPVAAYLESQRLDGVPLLPDEAHLLEGAKEFPKNPFAAQLKAKEASGKISGAEMSLLQQLKRNSNTQPPRHDSTHSEDGSHVVYALDDHQLGLS